MSLGTLRELRDKRRTMRGVDYRQHIVVYQATESNTSATPEEVALDASLPQLRVDCHPLDTSAFVVSVSAAQIPKTVAEWEIEIVYETPRGRTLAEQVQEVNPLLRPADVGGTFDVIEVPVYYDVVTGFPIMNSACLPYEPPVMDKAYLEVLTLTRNESIEDFTLDRVRTYNNTLNELEFGPYKQYECHLLITNWTRQTENSVTYWRVSYEIRCRVWKLIIGGQTVNVGWREPVVDRGLSAYFDGKLKPICINVATGQYVADDGLGTYPRVDTPVFLDGQGHVIQPSLSMTPIVKLYNKKTTANWSALRLEYE